MSRSVIFPSLFRHLTFSAFAACLALSCNRNPSSGAAYSKEGSAKPEAAEAKAAPAEAKAVAVVNLGYQRIGTPFLMKSRSEGLNKRLEQVAAKAEWKEFKHGPALLEAINAKEVDIGYVGETPPVFAQAGGTPLIYVATDPPSPKSEAIIVRKESTIRSVAELKGKKIALNRGSNVHYLLVKALESAKLTIKDVEVIYLAPGDARPAFETGQVDAWVIWDPFYSAAETTGARTLVNGEGLVDNHQFYVARREFAEKYPAILNAVLDEYRILSEWETQNAEEVARVLNASSGVSVEALLLAERRHAYGVLPITPQILEKQQAIADIFFKLELIPKSIRTSDAFLASAVYTSQR